MVVELMCLLGQTRIPGLQVVVVLFFLIILASLFKVTVAWGGILLALVAFMLRDKGDKGDVAVNVRALKSDKGGVGVNVRAPKGGGSARKSVKKGKFHLNGHA